jgi:hypothetical protein
MITCNIATIGKKNLPENWDELNAAKYVAVFRSLAKKSVEGQEMTEQDYFLDILLQWWQTDAAKLCGLNWWEAFKQRFSKNQIHIPTLLMLELQEEVFPFMKFLFDDKKLCTTNHLIEFEHEGVVYAGPAAKLLNVTGAEMEVSEYCYAAYIAQNRSRKQEISLLATLWRESKEDALNGDFREPFNEHSIDARERAFSTLPDEMVTAMRVFYEHCMRMWIGRYPKVFKKGSDNEKPDPMAWRKLNRAIAGEKRGSVKEVQALKVSDIFFELNEMEKERKRMEDFYDKMKNKS